MKNEKGIFARLLAITGAILVAVGVFVFQGVSRADNTEDGGGDGSVGVIIADPENEDPEDNEGENTENGEDPADGENTGEGENTENGEKTEDGKDGEDPGDSEDEKDSKDEKDPEDSEKEPEMETFTMIYDANGGTGAPKAQTVESNTGEGEFTVADKVPTRDGYEFRGWNKLGDDSVIYLAGNTVKHDSAEEILILRAVWAEIKTYALLYDVNGGSPAPEIQVCKSASGSCSFIVSDVMPSKASASFLGWQRGDETYGPGNEIIVTETNTILIANWNPIYTFTLTYTSEEGTESLPDTQSCETAMGTCTFIVPEKEPTRNGYIFMGWRWDDQPEMLAKAGDELVVAIDGPLDLKIHAVWSKVYPVLNSGEVFGAGERVVLRSAASLQNFQKLTIDSEEVPAEYYILSDTGMTAVMLSNAFSQSLSSGEHAFTITWADGEASGIISVTQNEDGTKRFVVVDASGSSEGVSLMYRPRSGAVSKESSGITADAATDNEESNFDAVKILVVVAVAAFVVVYIVNRFYVRHKMDFIENF